VSNGAWSIAESRVKNDELSPQQDTLLESKTFE